MKALYSVWPRCEGVHGMNDPVEAMPNYHVVSWETGEVFSSWEKLGVAKRWARGKGHTWEDDPMLTGYPPIAYLADNDGLLVYNPRFGKQISEAVGGLINSLPSDYF